MGKTLQLRLPLVAGQNFSSFCVRRVPCRMIDNVDGCGSIESSLLRIAPNLFVLITDFRGFGVVSVFLKHISIKCHFIAKTRLGRKDISLSKRPKKITSVREVSKLPMLILGKYLCISCRIDVKQRMLDNPMGSCEASESQNSQSSLLLQSSVLSHNSEPDLKIRALLTAVGESPIAS